MGIFGAISDSIGGVLADQWKDFVSCDAIPSDTIMVRGEKRVSANSSNKASTRDFLTEGSLVLVADGQAAIVVDCGKVTHVWKDPGEHEYRKGKPNTIWEGTEGIKGMVEEAGKRVSFGGMATPAYSRVYYVNTKLMEGNPIHETAGIPVTFVDRAKGIEITGNMVYTLNYTFRIGAPEIFYKNMAGNQYGSYSKNQLLSQVRSEIKSAMLTHQTIVEGEQLRPSELGEKVPALTQVVRENLQKFMLEMRGIEIVTISITELNVQNCDLHTFSGLQKDAVYTDPGMAAATIVGATASAMQSAASNEKGGGAAMVYAAQAGGQTEGFEESAKAADSFIAPDGSWQCSCGALSRTKFCMDCGSPRPKAWQCSCGKICSSKFCMDCGSKNPWG